jgi:hypothetical protein
MHVRIFMPLPAGDVMAWRLLLDAFCFLHDVSKSKRGGLQTAGVDRGGISKHQQAYSSRPAPSN